MEKNFLVLFCFITSIIGLILIYIAAINLEPEQIELKEINIELVGRSVLSKGEIVHKKSHDAGHLFLTISDRDTNIQVPLFSGYLNSLKEVNITKDNLEVGKIISVSGLVSEYQGQIQIIPRRIDDVKILSE
jgi:DNA/RNA endonuclease YhcR with UshA esterase domain